MSGHNKWSQIKHKKAKEDAKKGKAFTKIIKEITVAARAGGGDPAHNAPLRNLLDEAKQINMPLDNALRAIKRGTGELPGVQYEPITYEGYGPHGVAIMIDTLSDNRNRTVAELRHIFQKHGGTLGETGSVGWMFEHLGVVECNKNATSEDQLFEMLLECDIQDITHDDESWYVLCAIKHMEIVKNTLSKAGIAIQKAHFDWIPKNSLELSDNDSAAVVGLLSALEEHDDVQNTYTTMA